MINEKWSHKLEYILSVLGYALGVGTIWKFPYMCARNGGGSFLFPYILFSLIGSIPLTYLENFVGQFSQLNCFDAWQICPSLRGLALGSLFMSWIFFIYYPVLLVWSLYYLYYSFSLVLPWTLCGQSWNSDNCLADMIMSPDNLTGLYTNSTKAGSFHDDGVENVSSSVPAAEEFFRHNLLQITDGLHTIGTMRWPLTACLFAVFLCIYLCIVKGIRISGKVVYVTATAPYILVTVIFIRACTLPGSLDGLLYFLTPEFEKLLDLQIWMEACSLAVYLPGICFGSLMTMASHNQIRNNCLWDAVTLNLLITCSTVYFGFSIFAVTGHLAYKRGVSMDSYSTSGFKLGFITYPEATSFLPLPQLWSVFLFLMLLTLGIDSLIPAAEVVDSIIAALVPRLAGRPWLLKGLLMSLSFLLAVPYTAQGGIYLMTLVEWFSFFPSLAVFGFMELITVAWIYGTPRIDTAMRKTMGRGLPKIMVVLWKYLCPCLFLMVSGYSLYTYTPPRFEDFVYPFWANVLGWILSLAVVSPVPLFFLWSVWKAQGSSLVEKVKASVRPRGPWLLDTEDGCEVQERNELMSI